MMRRKRPQGLGLLFSMLGGSGVYLILLKKRQLYLHLPRILRMSICRKDWRENFPARGISASII